jgi:CheY-like chemotaxis protein
MRAAGWHDVRRKRSRCCRLPDRESNSKRMSVVGWQRPKDQAATSTASLVASADKVKDSSFLRNRNVVIVVDDDVATLRGIERLLRQFGYPSMLFATAEAFEDHGLEQGLCAIFDINLNDNRSGVDLRLGLKAAGCPLPVIYITGNDSPAVRTAALQSGCLAYITKPFSAQSLIEPLKRASAS